MGMEIPRLRWMALIMIIVWALRLFNVPTEYQAEIAAAAMAIAKIMAELANQIAAETPDDNIYKSDQVKLTPFWERVL